jgi:hypothetical protein
MSRSPTRQLTWPFVLRTFKRVDMIASRYSAEWMAKALVERGVDISASDYMRDIWEYMRDLKKAAGGSIYAHPNGNCPQCGHDIGRDHNGARYCSTSCRQRAWRERHKAVRLIQLYRLYDKDGALLYVGVSGLVKNRLALHKKKSPWFDAVARMTVDSYPTRKAALVAEARAILAEKPRFNRNVLINHETVGDISIAPEDITPVAAARRDDASTAPGDETNVTKQKGLRSALAMALSGDRLPQPRIVATAGGDR